MATERDFSLPFDLLVFAQIHGGPRILRPGPVAKPPSAFTKIQKKNIFVDRRPYKLKEVAVCHYARPGRPPTRVGVPRQLFKSLHDDRIQPRTRVRRAIDARINGESLSLTGSVYRAYSSPLSVQTAGQGYGLQVSTAIKPSTLVLEDQGEIISAGHVPRPHARYSSTGVAKGTDARFVNHSCEPNCSHRNVANETGPLRCGNMHRVFWHQQEGQSGKSGKSLSLIQESLRKAKKSRLPRRTVRGGLPSAVLGSASADDLIPRFHPLPAAAASVQCKKRLRSKKQTWWGQASAFGRAWHEGPDSGASLKATYRKPSTTRTKADAGAGDMDVSRAKHRKQGPDAVIARLRVVTHGVPPPADP
ncbi:hypothetical protein DFJ77DRAFT_442598 [Powellomyces hirtus]|nr:hypothetical protein DFJ77DRAFT_442598 [Powellomyces hirtus]